MTYMASLMVLPALLQLCTTGLASVLMLYDVVCRLGRLDFAS